MIDQTTIDKLNMLHDTLQPFIDEVARKRQSASSDKYLWSYVSKKIDLAGKAIGLALDKIEEQETQNRLLTGG